MKLTSKMKNVQLGKYFGLDFALDRGPILSCWEGEVKSTHNPFLEFKG